MRLLLLLLVTLACGAPSRAQVIELSAGASTAYGAEGGTVTVHGEHSESSFGAGLVGGHFGAGGETIRSLGPTTLALGQQRLAVDLPTDLFSFGHTLATTGLGLHGMQPGGDAWTAFAGFSTAEGGSPLFRTAALGSRTALGQYRFRISPACSLLSTVLLTHSTSALESLDCRPSKQLSLALTAGMGARAPYLAGSVNYEGRRLQLRAASIVMSPHFDRGTSTLTPLPEPVRENLSSTFHLSRTCSLSGVHENYLTPAPAHAVNLGGKPGDADHSSLDQIALQYQHRVTGLGLSLMRSSFISHGKTTHNASPGPTSNTSLALAFEHSFGRVRWTETLLGSRPVTGTVAPVINLLSGLSLPVNEHLRLAETVSNSGGHTVFAHGGELVTAISTFHVDHQLLYLAMQPAHPFQQALVFSAETRLLRRMGFKASSTVDHRGQTHYTFALSTVYARQGAATLPDARPGAALGLHLLQGIVLDTDGAPVGGAALLIGSEHLYTDSAGSFTLRSRSTRSVTLHVLCDEFLTAGEFVAVAGPLTVSPGVAAPILRIIVRRVPSAALALPISSSSSSVSQRSSRMMPPEAQL